MDVRTWLNSLTDEEDIQRAFDLAYYYAESGDFENFSGLLSNYNFLDIKNRKRDLESVIKDYDYASSSLLQNSEEYSDTIQEALLKIQNTLGLCTDILSENNSQLACQLWARLRDSHEPLVEKLLAQASESQDIWLQPLTASFDLKTNNSLYAEHNILIPVLVMTANSQKVITGDTSGKLAAWSVSTGQKLYDFQYDEIDISHPDYWYENIVNIFLAEYTNNVISVHESGRIKIWDIDTGQLVHIIADYRNSSEEVVRATACAFSLGKTFLVIAFEDETLSVFSLLLQENVLPQSFYRGDIEVLSTGRLYNEDLLVDFENGIGLIYISSSSGDLIVRCTSDGWCLPSNQPQTSGIQYIRGHAIEIQRSTDTIFVQGFIQESQHINFGIKFSVLADDSYSFPEKIELSSDESHIVISHMRGGVEILNLNEAKKTNAFQAYSLGCLSVAISSDGQHLTSSGQEGLRFWKLTPHAIEPENNIVSCNSAVTCVDIDSTGNLALSVNTSKTINLWELNDSQEIFNFSFPAQPFNKALISHDSRYIVVDSSPKEISVWNIENKSCTHTIYLGNKIHDILNFEISFDNQYIVVCAQERENKEDNLFLQLWKFTHLGVNRKKSKYICSTVCPGNRIVKHIASIPQSPNFLFSSGNNKLYLWNVESNQVSVLIELEEEANINSFVVSPISQDIIISAVRQSPFIDACVIWVWDLLGNSKFYKKVSDSFSYISHMAISENEQFLLTCSGMSVTVWETPQFESVANFLGTSQFSACSISSESGLVVLGDRTGMTHLLRLTQSNSF